jgi:hemoglobin-like flavoprotein
MSAELPKMDNSQRQQIMANVQQQLALQNAQELLQVIDRIVYKHYSMNIFI